MPADRQRYTTNVRFVPAKAEEKQTGKAGFRKNTRNNLQVHIKKRNFAAQIGRKCERPFPHDRLPKPTGPWFSIMTSSSSAEA